MKTKANSFIRKLTRFFYASGVVMLLAGMVLSVVASPVQATVVNDNIKVVVCHATASSSNPYVKVTVSVHSVDDANGLNGHGNHDDDSWAPFTYKGVNYPGRGNQTLVRNGCNVPTETATVTETKTVTATETKTETQTVTATETQTVTATETQTVTVTETQTVTPSETVVVTETPTETPTETLTETPTETLTETPTETVTETPAPLLPLQVTAICSALVPNDDDLVAFSPMILWSVYNPNASFSVPSFLFNLDEGVQAGTIVGPVAPLSSFTFLSTGDGNHKMVVSFSDSYYGDVETSVVLETTICQQLTETPVVTETQVTKTVVVTATPDPSETPVTRIPTLGQPPVSGSGGPVLIPVTGDDLSTTSTPAVSFASLFTNFGLMFLGLGLVFHAASKKFVI